MNGNDANNRALTPKQITAITHYLVSGSIEEACRRARVGKTTFYKWLKDDEFKEQIREQREAITRQALEILKAAISKATAVLLNHLDSPRESIALRAAEKILDFALKAKEADELEVRIEALEAIIKERGHKR